MVKENNKNQESSNNSQVTLEAASDSAQHTISSEAAATTRKTLGIGGGVSGSSRLTLGVGGNKNQENKSGISASAGGAGNFANRSTSGSNTNNPVVVIIKSRGKTLSKPSEEEANIGTLTLQEKNERYKALMLQQSQESKIDEYNNSAEQTTNNSNDQNQKELAEKAHVNRRNGDPELAQEQGPAYIAANNGEKFTTFTKEKNDARNNSVKEATINNNKATFVGHGENIATIGGNSLSASGGSEESLRSGEAIKNARSTGSLPISDYGVSQEGGKKDSYLISDEINPSSSNYDERQAGAQQRDSNMSNDSSLAASPSLSSGLSGASRQTVSASFSGKSSTYDNSASKRHGYSKNNTLTSDAAVVPKKPIVIHSGDDFLSKKSKFKDLSHIVADRNIEKPIDDAVKTDATDINNATAGGVTKVKGNRVASFVNVGSDVDGKVNNAVLAKATKPDAAAAAKRTANRSSKLSASQIARLFTQDDEESNSSSAVASMAAEMISNRAAASAGANYASSGSSSNEQHNAVSYGGGGGSGRSNLRSTPKFRRRGQAQSSLPKLARNVELSGPVTVSELAAKMSEKVEKLLKVLRNLGLNLEYASKVTVETAELVCMELGHKLIYNEEYAEIKKLLNGTEAENSEMLEKRPPIVTVMGHVDHGKTSLLDALRYTDVAAKEAGGITQHIGAYMVHLASGSAITFIDTPGHEAFSMMRMRGAQLTDIVVLVVAADDGIKAQTLEAISHAKAAQVPIIVAVNKMDKGGVKGLETVSRQLLEHELIPESMGGEVMVIGVSAKEKTGLDLLEDAILLQAETLDIRANPHRRAQGRVIEVRAEKGRGTVCTLLIQRGTLAIGDLVVIGSHYGKVRSLTDDKGKQVKNAGLSRPVEVLGFDGEIGAGDEFAVVKDEKAAKTIVDYRKKMLASGKNIDELSVEGKFMNEKSFFASEMEGDEINFIIKGDVNGSVEAIKQSLLKLSDDKVKINILFSGIGEINESDVLLAAASKAHILGFNRSANNAAKIAADKHQVNITSYSIIYDLLDDVKLRMKSLHAPEMREEIVGNAEIRKIFTFDKTVTVAGCYVTLGTMRRNGTVRILRDRKIITECKIKSLKRQKEDVREVREGFECGIVFDRFDAIQEGDMVQYYVQNEVK